ncbi:Cilia- and flagella-associated protein 91, partial [Gonapodya sp. JEL0774]
MAAVMGGRRQTDSVGQQHGGRVERGDRQAAVAKSRQFDYVYDPLYTVSSLSDHTHALASAVAPSPLLSQNFNNLFSVLPHFPHAHLVLKHSIYSAIPPGLGSDRSVPYLPPHVSGQNRYKYFRRPILPYIPGSGPGGIAAHSGAGISGVVWAKKYANGNNNNISSSNGPLSPSSHRTFGTPATPSHSPTSAFFSSSSSSSKHPSSSSSSDRPATPGVRTVAVQTMYRLQSARLALLASQRAAQSQASSASQSARLSSIWSRKLAAHARAVHDIDARRAKAVRKLLRRREAVARGVDAAAEVWGGGAGAGAAGKAAPVRTGAGAGGAGDRRDIIKEYGDYGSGVYVPRVRDGRTKKSKWEGIEGATGVGVGGGLQAALGMEGIEWSVDEVD